MVEIVIQEVAPSANNFYSGMHIQERRRLVERWHLLVLVELRRQRLKRFEGEYPVDVECVCRFGRGSRTCDADNLFPTVKMILDGLVIGKYLKGDSPRFIRSVTLVPERSENGKSYTVIRITEVEE